MDHEDSVESTFFLFASDDMVRAWTAFDRKLEEGVKVEMQFTFLPPFFVAIEPTAFGVSIWIKGLKRVSMHAL